MELQKLVEMQLQLDQYIEEKRGIKEDVFNRKVIALLVELGELANETRSFKFWSDKGPSDKATIVEEYVDSIHFLLSIGIEKGLDTRLSTWPVGEELEDLNTAFLYTYEQILTFQKNTDFSNYAKIWEFYAEIARLLGFTTEDVVNAYHAKNEINYTRQQTGY